MFKNLSKLQLPLVLASVVAISLTACKKEETPTAPDTNTPPASSFRGSFDYAKLTATTPYDSLFVDASAKKTVDLNEGNTRLNMFIAFDTYVKTPNNAGTANLDSNSIKNYFTNTGNPFADSALNSSGLQLRNVTATSVSNTAAELARIETYFAALDIASDSVMAAASYGKAGKMIAGGTNVSKYLLDADGLEQAQVISKSLMGAFQFDYIVNVLLSDAQLSSANNNSLVAGKNYTQLEHNWDVAYSTFTLSKVYGGAATATTSGEKLLGAYAWEYGKTDYVKIHPAFLRGRAAIVNNDIAEAKKQAGIIRSCLEKAIASASAGYLKKWKDNVVATPGSAYHAFAEGFGFIYSLRFCKQNGADAAFSNELMNDLIYSAPAGLWEMTDVKANAAIAKINAKFGL